MMLLNPSFDAYRETFKEAGGSYSYSEVTIRVLLEIGCFFPMEVKHYCGSQQNSGLIRERALLEALR